MPESVRGATVGATVGVAEGSGVRVVVGRGVGAAVVDGEDDSAGAATGGSTVQEVRPPTSNTASTTGRTRADFTWAVSHRGAPPWDAIVA